MTTVACRLMTWDGKLIHVERLPAPLPFLLSVRMPNGDLKFFSTRGKPTVMGMGVVPDKTGGCLTQDYCDLCGAPGMNEMYLDGPWNYR